jgi:ubiquinone/menaquinone biosynthesis C-methylase UbiE
MNSEQKLTERVYSGMVEKEWKRLKSDAFHRLEFDSTMYFLDKYLPKKGLILDAGGGPGRYTIELAKRGYEVVLLDLVASNLEMAKRQIKKAGVQNKVKGVTKGSITDLSNFKDSTFDAVICLGGPLSHVAPEYNRKRAISELSRVAKRGSLVFISVMGKFGTLLQSPQRWPEEVSKTKHFEDFSIKGDDYLWIRKYFCHYFTRDELINITSKKLKLVEIVGLEGLASSNHDAFNKMYKDYPNSYRNWMKMHYKLITNPTVVDVSQHILIMGRKK